MCVMTLHNESKSHENPPQIDPFQIEDWNCDCFSSKWGTLAYSAHRDGLGKKSPKRPKMKVAKFEKLFYKICVHTLDYLKKS